METQLHATFETHIDAVPTALVIHQTKAGPFIIVMTPLNFLAILLASTATCTSATLFPQFNNNRLTGSSFGIPNVPAEYDYIIVGGGTAGSVAAARFDGLHRRFRRSGLLLRNQ